jgi:hypothetical protein
MRPKANKRWVKADQHRPPLCHTLSLHEWLLGPPPRRRNVRQQNSVSNCSVASGFLLVCGCERDGGFRGQQEKR